MTQCAGGASSRVTRTSAGDGHEQPLAQVALGGGRRDLGGDVEHRQRLHPVQPEQPHVLRAPAPALEVPPAVDEQHPHRVDVPLGGLVPGGHEVGQVHPAATGQRPPDVGQRALDLDLHPHLGAGRAGLAGRGLELEQGALQGVPVVQPRDVGQRAEPDQQGQRLVDAEPQRPGDRVGVAEVDAAVVPVDLDQVVRQVARRPADEEQLEVLDQLRLGDPELGGDLGERDALPAHQVRHEREQPGQAVGGAGAHRPAPVMPLPRWRQARPARHAAGVRRRP